MERTLTISQIVSLCKDLKPTLAAQFPHSNFESLCTSPTFESVLIDGEAKTLNRRQGKVGAGYIRVSTPQQRSRQGQGDGFSEDDQLERVIRYFIDRGEAFRIFSDAGLSGSLPTSDPFLVQRLWDKKAELYRDIFTTVLLKAPGGKYAPSEIASMTAFMEDAVVRLREGASDTGVLSELHDSAAVDEEAPGRHTPKRVRKRTRYRPGLTVLMQELPQLHSIALTDLSRLARNQLFFAILSETIAAARVQVVGVIESLDWMNQRGNIGGDIIAAVLPVIAEYRLREVALGALRGIAAMLESGRAHGKIPSWLERDRDGFAQLKAGNGQTAIRRMVELYLETNPNGNVNGYSTVAQRLNEEGWKNGRGTQWNVSTVGDILVNPALIGRQRVFGKDWNVFPRLIDDATFLRVQRERVDRNVDRPGRKRVNPDGYLMSGLIHCSCGHTLHFKKTPDGRYSYCCRANTVHRRAMEPRRHVILNQPDTDAFFERLMETHPHIVVQAFQPGDRREQIRRELERLERQLEEVQAQAARRAGAMREKAEQYVLGLNVQADHPMFLEMVERTLKALLLDKDDMEGDIQGRIREHRAHLNAVLDGDQVAGIEERVGAWKGLRNYEKNAILKTLFRDMRVQGTAPEEYITLELNTPENDALPPIYLKTSERHTLTRGIRYFRRMPTVAEWIQSFHRHVHEEA